MSKADLVYLKFNEDNGNTWVFLAIGDFLQDNYVEIMGGLNTLGSTFGHGLCQRIANLLYNSNDMQLLNIYKKDRLGYGKLRLSKMERELEVALTIEDFLELVEACNSIGVNRP